MDPIQALDMALQIEPNENDSSVTLSVFFNKDKSIDFITIDKHHRSAGEVSFHKVRINDVNMYITHHYKGESE